MDRVSKQQRSFVMSAVRAKGTKLEDRFCAALRSEGLRGFRRNVESLPGRPDVVFRSARVAIFVDSCFWHGCPSHLRMPASNLDYWTQKIRRNKARDRAAARLLRQGGWTVVRVWEHQLREDASRRRMLARVEMLVTTDGRRTARR